ncbi:MAG: succinate dehydrogenase, cytochrome b556 subunit [Candidatus Micrarchaeaceae archaeon]
MAVFQSLQTEKAYRYANRKQVWSAVGMWAWFLHRLTGIGLVFYISLHVILMSAAILEGHIYFNHLLTLLMTDPVFLVLDAILAGAVIYHALNGIRLILFDLGIGFGRQKEIFWSLMIPGALIYIVILVRIIPEFAK